MIEFAIPVLILVIVIVFGDEGPRTPPTGKVPPLSPDQALEQAKFRLEDRQRVRQRWMNREAAKRLWWANLDHARNLRTWRNRQIGRA